MAVYYAGAVFLNHEIQTFDMGVSSDGSIFCLQSHSAKAAKKSQGQIGL
jgi:hypothetical protein